MNAPPTLDPRTVVCPECLAAPGAPCVDPSDAMPTDATTFWFHHARKFAATQADLPSGFHPEFDGAVVHVPSLAGVIRFEAMMRAEVPEETEIRVQVLVHPATGIAEFFVDDMDRSGEPAITAFGLDADQVKALAAVLRFVG